MAEKLLIDAHYKDETRIAIIDENGVLENFEAEHSQKKPIKGNIYLAKIARIEPSIQAAFIDYGAEKHGFLPLSEIHEEFFNKTEQKDGEEIIPEDQEQPKRKKSYKIQDVISNKQIVLVQAEKDVRGNKCASFSTHITIPGRYCVLMPNSEKGKTGGISKKLDSAEKERLKEIIKDLDIPEGMGCIVRTAGKNRTKQEIKRDFEYLLRLWSEIKEKLSNSTAPCLLHEEGNIIKRTIRDLYKRTTEKIIIQGQAAYKEAKTFMKLFTPSHVKKIELYDDSEIPLFHKYEIEEKINLILNPTVVLPSGGTIVINQTEALTAIDVNSGKMRNERALEDTALKTNLEAAIEIARQIKLRDIAGIIVIDFIDMGEYSSISKVEKKFKDAVKDDYSSMQIGKISQFGLLEISRQRLRASLADSNFVQCKHCGGSGKILSNETVALSVLRKIETFLVKEKPKSIIAEVANGVDLFILNNKRRLIVEMEETFNTSIEIIRNLAINALDCKIIVKEYANIDTKIDPVKKEDHNKEQLIEKKKKQQKDPEQPKEIIEQPQEETVKPAKAKFKYKKKKVNHNKSTETKSDAIELEEKLVNKTNIHAAVDIIEPEKEEEVAVAKKRKRRRKPKKKIEEPSVNTPDNESTSEDQEKGS